jgi:hypothetical protein
MAIRRNAWRYPFQAGGIVGADYFWGRDDERRRIAQVYEAGTIAVLAGQRRMGKTSLAEIVGRDLASAGKLRWGMLSVRETTPANFPDKLLSTVFSLRQDRPVRNVFDRAVAFARTIRIQPRVEADPATGVVGFKFDAHRAGANPDDAAVYHAILEMLEDAPAAGRPVALVLDEFQDVTKSAPLFPEVLKSRARSGQGVAILLMGSSQHLMDELVSSPSAPLYRIGGQISLGPLPRDIVRREAQRRFGWNSVVITNAVMDQLYDVCDGVSQDIQLLCFQGLEEALRHGWDEITPERLEIVVQDVVEQNIDRFVDRWNLLTAIQRQVLVAVAQYGGTGVFGREFLRRIDPARPFLPATVRRSLLAMVDKDILEYAPPEGYRFKDALMRAYIRRLVAV